MLNVTSQETKASQNHPGKQHLSFPRHLKMHFFLLNRLLWRVSSYNVLGPLLDPEVPSNLSSRGGGRSLNVSEHSPGGLSTSQRANLSSKSSSFKVVGFSNETCVSSFCFPGLCEMNTFFLSPVGAQIPPGAYRALSACFLT